jgi:hypothetical protein
MLAVVVVGLVLHPADVRDVRQQVMQACFGEQLPAALQPVLGSPLLIVPAASSEFLHHLQQPLVLEV